MKLEIIIEVNGVKYWLDLTGVDQVPINYSLDDITDISSVNGSWTKSITIPATDHNMKIYNLWSDPNISSQYDPRSINRAYILSNTYLQLEGNFILRESNDNKYTGDKKLTLNIYGDNVDIWSSIGDKELSTLDISEFNHTYDYNTITSAQSSTSSHLTGYDYPFSDMGQDWSKTKLQSSLNCPRVSDFQPWIYIYQLFNKIIQEEGYNWKSNSLTQSTPIQSLIINNGYGEIRHTEEYLNDNAYRISLSSDQSINTTTTYPSNIPYGSYYVQPYNLPSVYKQEKTDIVLFDNVNSPNGDPSGSWLTPSNIYINTTTSVIHEKFYFYFEIDQLRLWPYTTTPTSYCAPRIQVKINGVPVQTSEDYLSSLYLPVIDGNSSLPWSVSNTQSFGSPLFETYKGYFKTPTLTLNPGDILQVEYTSVIGGKFPTAIAPGTTIAKIKKSTFSYNQIDPLIKEGDLMEMNSVLPKKFKRRDLLMSIIKMFNLIIEVDKNDKQLLNIEVRDSYYDSGSTEDWTSKIDRLNGYTQKSLVDTQNRQIKFKYKDDSDYFNNDYKSITKETYGEYIYDSGNKNTKGVKTQEIYFSPTPIVGLPGSIAIGTTQSPMMVYPKIVVNDNGVFKFGKSNIRILQRKPKVPTSDTWLFNGISQGNTYPYAGHYDDPIQPTSDINFGQTDGLYYPQSQITNNNLINKYWLRTLDELFDKSSRILTCKVFLTSADIYNFRFNKKIAIDLGNGIQYYRVNRIIDYNPINDDSTSVEFVKLNEVLTPITSSHRRAVVIPEGTSNIGNSTSTEIMGFSHLPGPGESTGSGIFFGSNRFIGSNNSSFGENNKSNGDNNSIFGNNNIAGSENSLINGNENIIGYNSENNKIIGNNNIVNNYVSNSKIFGDNNTINTSTIGTTSNVVIIGSNLTVDEPGIYISGPTVNNINKHSACRNEVINPFSDDIINLYSASRNKVRENGSLTIISKLSGGRNTII